METGHGIKYRQLHMEDYLQEIPAEQGRAAGVYAHEWITGNTDTDTDFWTENPFDTILRSDNLNAAYRKVKANKGSGGIDGMQVDELLPYLRDHQSELVEQIRKGKYRPNPVRRVEIPKEEKGQVRKLGVPTITSYCTPPNNVLQCCLQLSRQYLNEDLQMLNLRYVFKFYEKFY